MHIFDELKERGLVFQTTDEEALRKALEEGQVLIILVMTQLLTAFTLVTCCHLDKPSSSTSRPQTLCARWRCDWSHWRSVLQRC